MFRELCRFSGSYIGVQGAVQVFGELVSCAGLTPTFQAHVALYASGYTYTVAVYLPCTICRYV